MKMTNKLIIAMGHSRWMSAPMMLTLVIAFLGMTGCKDSGNPREQSSPGAASASYDLQIIDTMAAHHQSAIDMAKMAESMALHEELKSFAKTIVADQEREIARLKQWREQWHAGKPKAENMDLPGMMESMKGMTMDHMKKMKTMMGADFDRMFLDMMIPHHQGAVTMAKDALSKAEHPEIKTLAQQIIDAQQKEIEMMNKWKAAWSSTK